MSRDGRTRWRSAAARRVRELAGRETVEEAVEELARRLTAGQTEPPIDFAPVFHRAGVRAYREEEDLLTAGALRPAAGGGFEVVVSALETPGRRRFTAAHEIGHVVMERTGRWRPRRGVELERICDLIAVHLLLPAPLFRRELRRPVTAAEVARLAARFEASFTTVAYRCLDFAPIALLRMEGGKVVGAAGWRGFGVSPAAAGSALLTAIRNNSRAGEAAVSPDRSGRRNLLRAEWRSTGAERTIVLVREDPPQS